MFWKKLAAETAGPAGLDGPAPRGPAPKVNGGLALAGAALFFAAAATLLLTARGNPYDGGPVARARILFSAAHSTVCEAGRGPSLSGAGALPPAPIAGLSAPGPGGLLPIISADGRASWKAYARPFTDDGRPKIALVIGGLGLNPDQARQAIDLLPPEVTLSFSPYAENLQALIDRARAAGHEVMVELPMEPLDYPDNDPGPYTLLSNAQPGEIQSKLDWLMSRATGYFAVTNAFGSRFLSQDRAMAPVVQSLRQRGVAFVDDGQAAGRGGGLHRASMGPRIDADLDSGAIDNQLLSLEAMALQSGAALGTGSGYPLTVNQVQKWAVAVRERGYALAPASALMTLKP
ncbi:MAG: divergent polysaccharide deacetylase family protein [Caulobacteraceae bacterium]